MLGKVAWKTKKTTHTQDLSRRSIATSGESVSMYPRRPKAEPFINTVDVVERLHDPIDPSTERTAPLCSAHVQHDDVPRALDLVEDEGEFSQHDDVVTVMKVTGAGHRLSTTTI